MIIQPNRYTFPSLYIHAYIHTIITDPKSNSSLIILYLTVSVSFEDVFLKVLN